MVFFRFFFNIRGIRHWCIWNLISNFFKVWRLKNNMLLLSVAIQILTFFWSGPPAACPELKRCQSHRWCVLILFKNYQNNNHQMESNLESSAALRWPASLSFPTTSELCSHLRKFIAMVPWSTPDGCWLPPTASTGAKKFKLMKIKN